MFLGRPQERSEFEQLYDDICHDLRVVLRHAGIETYGPSFPGWVGDGSALWKKPEFGKAFKNLVIGYEAEADAFLKRKYPTATVADLQGLARMFALRVITERWIGEHPMSFPDAQTKG